MAKPYAQELERLRNAFRWAMEAVTISLAQDSHGKSLSNVMLAIELPDPQ